MFKTGGTILQANFDIATLHLKSEPKRGTLTYLQKQTKTKFLNRSKLLSKYWHLKAVFKKGLEFNQNFSVRHFSRDKRKKRNKGFK